MNISKKDGIQLAVIPFSGFYNSVHDGMLDDAFEQMFQNDRGDPNQGLVRRAFDLVRWGDVHEAYAKAYAANFATEFEIPSMTFDELNSPREYNFTTDRIFVEVSTADMRKVFDAIDKETLQDQATAMFTSRSGFSSYYDPDIEGWGEVESWDHNQLLCLLTTLAGDEFDGWKQYDLMERDQCNGRFDSWLEDAMVVDHKEEANRLWNISYYLRQREERQWRHAA